MTYDWIDAWWWPFLFLLVAGWLATDVWRFLGVFVGDRIRDDSDLLVLVRAIATALVAAVIANLVVFPAGTLAEAPAFVRIGALAVGFGAYLAAGNRVIVGVVAGEAVLIAGMFAFADV
jgi:hypothetical protein